MLDVQHFTNWVNCSYSLHTFRRICKPIWCNTPKVILSALQILPFSTNILEILCYFHPSFTISILHSFTTHLLWHCDMKFLPSCYVLQFLMFQFCVSALRFDEIACMCGCTQWNLVQGCNWNLKPAIIWTPAINSLAVWCALALRHTEIVCHSGYGNFTTISCFEAS